MINFQLMPINVYFSLAGTRNTEVGKNSPCFELDDTRTSMLDWHLLCFNLLKARSLKSWVRVLLYMPGT